MEQPDRSRRDPRRDKELDYLHQRRSGAEYPHAWRRMLPAKKARSQRVVRRGQSAALRTARGHVDPVSAERATLAAEQVRRPVVRAWPNPTLGGHVAGTLRSRVDRVGWNFFKDPYSSDRHRRPFVRFLTALTTGRRGNSHALAERVDQILQLPAPARAAGNRGLRSWPPDARQHRAWLAAFFLDEPRWQARLTTWTAEVLHDPGDLPGTR